MPSASHEVVLVDKTGQIRVHLHAHETLPSIQLLDDQGDIGLLMNSGGTILAGGAESPGVLLIRNSSGKTVVEIEGHTGGLRLFDGSGAEVFRFRSGEDDLVIRDSHGREVFKLKRDVASVHIGSSGNEGDLVVKNNSGEGTIHLDGGSGRVLASAIRFDDGSVLNTAVPALKSVKGDGDGLSGGGSSGDVVIRLSNKMLNKLAKMAGAINKLENHTQLPMTPL